MVDVLIAVGIAVGLYILIYYNFIRGRQCTSDTSLKGKTVIVTGANIGIGKMTALDMAKRGARVILACRVKETGEASVYDIRRRTGNNQVLFMHLDLASLDSVRSFCKTFLSTEPRLDILINNAGIQGVGKTSDGFNLIFGVNHLGHFLLTLLLLDRLKQCCPSRIVVLASLAHKWGKIDFNNLNPPLKTWKDTFKSYCDSKLANVLFARELANRLQGTDVTCYSVHPGVVYTNLSRNAPRWLMTMLLPLFWLFSRTPMDGAQTSIFCAVQEGIEMYSGRYFANCQVEQVQPYARDDAVAKKLWEVSERLTGLTSSMQINNYLNMQKVKEKTYYTEDYFSGIGRMETQDILQQAVVSAEQIAVQTTKTVGGRSCIVVSTRQRDYSSVDEIMAAVLIGLGIAAGIYFLIYQNLVRGRQCKSDTSLKGKTVIVTGANAGIGKFTALDMARRGARVILACRVKERGEDAVCDIQRMTGNNQVLFMKLDLGNLASVRSFCKMFLSNEPRLDILINNAGVQGYGKTDDGFSLMFGVNHLGHFLLTLLLLDRLKQCCPSRVVVLASSLHKWGKIDFNNLNPSAETYKDSLKFYSDSKLANVLFARELANRLQRTKVTCYAVDPGLVVTNIGRYTPQWIRLILSPLVWPFFKNAKDGAQTSIFCAVQEGIEMYSGRYFANCQVKQVELHAQDDAVAKKLWEVSERLTGLVS
ncbi:dehydrogenase/reductase SDR family member 13 [Rhinophrynus dorsalis]